VSRRMLGCHGYGSNHVKDDYVKIRARRRVPVDSLKDEVYDHWNTLLQDLSWNPRETALVIVDTWASHTCKAQNDRSNLASPVINDIANYLRAKGSLVIFALGGGEKLYRTHPALKWVKDLPDRNMRKANRHKDPPFPLIIHGDNDGCQTEHDVSWNYKVHPSITIQSEDAILHETKGWWPDQSQTLWNIIQHRHIKNLIYVGDATNMCVPGRPYGIKVAVTWGLNVVLVRETTHIMYNPLTDVPYTSYEDAQELMLEFLEKFWCSTISSTDVTKT